METKAKPFVPFPPGTVRGPYRCGKGNDPHGGVQFAVRRNDGCWAYFIGRWGIGEAETRAKAEAYAKTVKGETKP